MSLRIKFMIRATISVALGALVMKAAELSSVEGLLLLIIFIVMDGFVTLFSAMEKGRRK